MALCDRCEALIGASGKVPPHAGLKYRAMFNAEPRTISERYRCVVCATGWRRDLTGKEAIPWKPESQPA